MFVKVLWILAFSSVILISSADNIPDELYDDPHDLLSDVNINGGTNIDNKACTCSHNSLRTKRSLRVPLGTCSQCGGYQYNNRCNGFCRNQCPSQNICRGNSCYCNPGLVYNIEIKQCVRPSDCSTKNPTCGINEIFSNCTNGGCFGARECSQIGAPTVCIKFDQKYCTKGCICEEGYLRGPNNTCIPEGQCACGENEVYSTCVNGGCFGARNCSEIGRPIICVDLIEGACEDGCLCKDGYLRNDDNVCVLQDQCPKTAPTCPSPHEKYDPNPQTCPPQVCDSLYKKYHCPLESENETNNGSCVCEDGYLRNLNGDCITVDECLKCTGPHEYYACGGACDNVCATLSTQNQTNCPIINVKCNEMCYCEKGYARDENNICIPIEKCPACGENEVYSTCVNGGCFGARNCSEIGRPIICVDLIEGACEDGCLCKDGYLRNDNGVCVPQDQCPTPGCPQNEVYDLCPATCPPRKCGVDEKLILCTIQPSIGDPDCPSPTCRCADGFYRNNNGNCVTWEECPPEVQCPENEVYDTCPASCPPRKCSVDESIIKCAAPPQPPNCPEPACRCADGFFRNDYGYCVALENCPKTCSQPNEIYNPCPVICPPQTCDSLMPGVRYKCPIQGVNQTCNGACVCEDGYYRNSIGECIKKEDCRYTCVPNSSIKCTGSNEYFSCGGACDNVCATLSEQNQTNCPIINVKCNEQCYCESGYARDSNNTCIPIEECPTCPEGETYNTCPPDECDAEYCPDSKDYALTCNSPKDCNPPRCVCGFNQRRDRITGKCIATADCPPFECNGQNEIYDSCPPVCPGQNCSDYINNSTCSKYKIGIVVQCAPQCRCEDSYYRNSEGVCIYGPDCLSKNESETCDEATYTENQERFSQGVASFTAKFLKTVVESQNSSCFMSAFSLDIPLAELALYSAGNTYNQLMESLNLTSKDQIRCVFQKYLTEVSSQENVTLELAAKVYVNKEYTLSNNFIKDTRDVFNATAENIDVSQPDQAADTINEWVAERTNDLITEIVSSDIITAYTILMLVNAIYFKGKWLNPFNPNTTINADFYVDSNTVIQVPTMYQKNSFKYGESTELDCKLIELLYDNKDFNCLVLLPNEIRGLNDLICKIQDTDKFNDALSNMSTQKTKLWIPKFDIETKIDLSDILTEIGITDIFDASKSNLTGILKEDKPLYVSTAIQKARIKFSEEGSEAAAANVIGVSTTSIAMDPPPEPEFKADHPFIYCIFRKNVPLFCGAYINGG